MIRIGIFRRAHSVSSIAAIAVLAFFATVTEGTTALSNPTKDFTVSETVKRELHRIGIPHTHLNRPNFDDWTVPPTTWIDDEYYTDDGAINDSMIRDRKDLYDEERNGNNDEDNDQPNVIAALDSQQDMSSSANSIHHNQNANMLFACGINAFLAWSFFFW